MKVGDEVRYKGYMISHPCKEDFVTEIAHNSLKDAKEWIDKLITLNVIVSPDEQLLGVEE